jgi:hypothetical protein
MFLEAAYCFLVITRTIRNRKLIGMAQHSFFLERRLFTIGRAAKWPQILLSYMASVHRYANGV